MDLLRLYVSPFIIIMSITSRKITLIDHNIIILFNKIMIVINILINQEKELMSIIL
jgi:hypothetical protein